LPDGLLVAVALAESGLHAHALNIGGRSYYPETAGEAARLLDSAGARQSVMAGCVQVNARVHDRRGSNWPLDPTKATTWAAKHLRMQYNRMGNWADAIRAWNGAPAGSSNKLVCRVQAKLEVVAPGENVLGSTGCGRTEIARAAQRPATAGTGRGAIELERRRGVSPGACMDRPFAGHEGRAPCRGRALHAVRPPGRT
jgi:hypothetical protein